MELSTRAKSSSAEYYHAAKVEHYAIDDVQIALRIFGQGPSLVLIHGYPVHGFTWRELIPTLAKDFTCYVIDLPGLGDSVWTKQSDFSIGAQARRVSRLLDNLRMKSCALIAHDTGAAIARLVALARPSKVARLVLFNTEIPGHRPPWIPFYQALAKLPGSKAVFRACLASPRFLRTSMGLGQFYSDKRLLRDETALACYVEPLTQDPWRLHGAIGYLQGIDWDIIDGLKTRHLNIFADTLFLWGEDDQTFPIAWSREMSAQFGGRTTFLPIKNASLMPHEEQPEAVLERLATFLSPMQPDPEHPLVMPRRSVEHAPRLTI